MSNSSEIVLSSSRFPALSEIVGNLLKLADKAYEVSTWFKPLPHFRYFSKGWGDLQSLPEARSDFDKFVLDYHAGSTLVPDVILSPERPTHGGFASYGRFKSPHSRVLPLECQECEFELLVPHGTPWACVIIFAGTGDQSYIFRRLALAKPLLQHGVASLLIMQPFYGPRKPASQPLHFVDNVSDFCHMGGAVMMESMVLLDWLKQRFPSALLGVTGLSRGGAMATSIGFLAKRHELAVASFLPASSLSVLVTGALRYDVAIDRLANELGSSFSDAENVLLNLFHGMSLSAMAELRIAKTDTENVTKAGIQISALHDAFVSHDLRLESHEAMQRFVDSRAEMRWLVGGHASSFAFARWTFVKPILETFRRLAASSTQPRSRL